MDQMGKKMLHREGEEQESDQGDSSDNDYERLNELMSEQFAGKLVASENKVDKRLYKLYNI